MGKMHPPAKRETIWVAVLIFIIFWYTYHKWWSGYTKCLYIDSNSLSEIQGGGGGKDSAEIASPSDLINGSLKFKTQDDIRVLNYIRKYHLQAPSPRNVPYNISNNPIHNAGVVQFVTQLFKGKKGGFFLECGANDGEYLANTLLLEKNYDWTGLLVEGDKDALKSLRVKQRKAWIGDFCLSPVPYPVLMNLEKASYLPMTHLVGYFFKDPATNNDARGQFTVQCFPLYSVLRALNVDTVDYFSLDVEGAEMPILKTLPFDNTLIIKVISLEYRGNKLEDFDNFLGSKGYRRVKLVTESGHTLDAIYAHESLQT